MRVDTNEMGPFAMDCSPSPFPSPPAWGRGLPASGGAEGDQGQGEGAIHTLHPLGLRGPMVYASAPPVQGAGMHLAFGLLGALSRLDPRWICLDDENEVTLRKSALGGPRLFVGDREGPSLSFSHGKGRLWAAMSGRGNVGIDAAYPEEFAGAYPFHRAFSNEELGCAETLCPNDRGRGAALMWAAKEASVKAIGAGFNWFDPLEVRAGTPFVREQGILFDVLADRPVSVWATPEGRGWLAVALA
jgi:hypothetical protein